ncbi:DUF2897 family protein [Photobacterium sp. MCCC 1A19761]|uniref:DUF2897 family protein n=1 Tax=Photobacterium sp. MCCC 1A19761 TaxID=3115000 RepID=UPI00307D49A3
MAEWLLNPWVISIIIVSVIVSNIAAIKYTANMKFGYRDKVKYMQEKHKREQAQQDDPDSNSHSAEQSNDSERRDH